MSNEMNHQTRTSLLTDWMAILNDICRCADIFIKLQYFNTNFTEHGNTMKLHGFVDASTKAYGVVVFLCSSDRTTFVVAKGHVASLKQIIMLKLELMMIVICM